MKSMTNATGNISLYLRRTLKNQQDKLRLLLNFIFTKLVFVASFEIPQFTQHLKL